MEMVRCLNDHMPRGFRAFPRVHLGSMYELDVNAYKTEFDPPKPWTGDEDLGGGLATANRRFHKPTAIIDADINDEYSYEVLVEDNDQTLVAAVEICSPLNQDRPTSHDAFVTQCRDLLQRGVCVPVVDLVVNKRFTCSPNCFRTSDSRCRRGHSGRRRPTR
jgi:hypothetical protein